MLRRTAGCLTPRRHLWPAAAPLGWLLLAGAPAAWAQAGGSGAVQVVPSASVTETLTDNALLSDTDRRADAITQLTAGVSVVSRRGRVQGSLDYQLTGSIHARETGANSTTNALRAALNADVIENFLSVDASASISQQAISAFGVQSTDPAFDNANRTEVRTYSITPAIRSRVGNWAVVDARLSHTQTSSGAGTTGDSNGDLLSVSLVSAGLTTVGWNLAGTRQRSTFTEGRSTTNDSFTGGLSYRPTYDVTLSANAGRESSDLTTPEANNTGRYGVGLSWTPTERTRISAQRDHRFFGDTHSLIFEHRMSRSTWRFSSSRDLSTALPSFVTTGFITQYDVLFALRAAQFPDPVLRRQVVLEELRLQGRNPNEAVSSTGFLNSAVTLVSRQDLSFALQGIRSTLSMSVYRSDSRRVDALANVSDDLNNGGRVRQQGLTLALGYRLTPSDGLSLTFSQSRTLGTANQAGNELQSLNLNWTSQLGQRSSLVVGARHVNFDSATAPYTENAVLATLGVRF